MGVRLRAVRLFFMHGGLALALATSAGCSGPALPTAPNLTSNGSTLFSIAIEAPSQSVAVGQQLVLSVSGLDDQGTPMAAPAASWKSSDPKVASITSTGAVTGLKKGRVTITATIKSPAREATVTLDVLGPGEMPGLGASSGTPADLALSIYPLTTRLAVGDRMRLVAYQGAAEGSADGATPAATTWTSSNPAIASVDEAGLVTGLQAGAATIEASSITHPGLSRQVALTVVSPASSSQIKGIAIRPARVSMNIGETFWLDADVSTWAGGYDARIRWIAGDSRLVSVSETGQLTGLAPGQTTVTAVASSYTAGELSATIPVEIRNTTSNGSFNN